MCRTISLDEANALCVELSLSPTPETRRRVVRALSLVDAVRLDAELGAVKVYIVPSQFHVNQRYVVLSAPAGENMSLVCSCPDFMDQNHLCKHAIAVRLHQKREAEDIARREQERIDREFAWFMAIDQQNFKETELQQLTGGWQ